MLKRAFFYTTRKRGKTLILLLTLFVISTFVLTGLSILAAADQSALSLRQSVGGSIKLELSSMNIFGGYPHRYNPCSARGA